MTKTEMIKLVRSMGANENTITAMENAYEMGVEAEREACAKVCEQLHPGLATNVAAQYIRNRGEA